MLRRREVIFFEIFLAVLIGIFIAASFNYAPRARLVPLVVGFFSLGLTIYQIVIEVTAPRGRKRESTEDKRTLSSKILHALSFAIGSGVLLLLLGYYLAMAVIVPGLTRYWFRESWPASITVTAGLLLFSYLLFNIVFGIDLYQGFIPSQVGWWLFD